MIITGTVLDCNGTSFFRCTTSCELITSKNAPSQGLAEFRLTFLDINEGRD